MNRIRQVLIAAAALLCIPASWGIQPGGGTVHGGTFDTSFTVEYSNSCLSGGCHETNQQLVTEYSQSFMTHTMVKCNACHGTHTAAEVGGPKPNITGYHPGIGATGYIVGKDRCMVCHTATQSNPRHPKRPGECVSCHSPHIFPANQ
jgi:hypothetical protein